MIDEFDALYSEEKSSLFPNLAKHNNFSDHKQVLIDFFAKIDQKTQEIKNSHAFKTFKQKLIMGSSTNTSPQEGPVMQELSDIVNHNHNVQQQ